MGEEAPTDTAVADTPAPVAEEATKTPIPAAEAPTLAVTDLDEVKKAAIRIESQGSFIHPQFGAQLNVAGGLPDS